MAEEPQELVASVDGIDTRWDSTSTCTFRFYTFFETSKYFQAGNNRKQSQISPCVTLSPSNSPHSEVAVGEVLHLHRDPWDGEPHTSEPWTLGRAGSARRSTRSRLPEGAAGGFS